jgi:carboxymethylenebutenolidase
MWYGVKAELLKGNFFDGRYTMKSSWERVKVDGGAMRVYVSVPDGQGPFPGVVAIQHRDGVDEFVEEMTRRLAGVGYFAAAPDLYHRDDPDSKDDAPTRMARLRDATVIQDVNAAVEFLKGHRSVEAERLGMVGFCMGGRVAYLLAAVNPNLKAAVSYYPGSLFASWGEGPSPFDRTKEIHYPMLGLFGQEDRNPSAEDIQKLDAELTKYGKAHEFHSFPNAGHAFMNFRAPSYRAHADQASWPKALDFLAKHLKAAGGRTAAAAR